MPFSRLTIGAALLLATATPVQARDRILHWAGRDWSVKGNGEPEGPGPNRFSPRKDDVFVDAQGWLHLRIVHRHGQWYSTEIASLQSLGYGTYAFDIAPMAAPLPGNAILGLFTYDMAPEEEHREIDIEMSRWGDGRADNVQCSIQPAEPADLHYRFRVEEARTAWTTAFTWAPGAVDCMGQALPAGAGAEPELLGAHRFTRAVPHPGREQVRLNLWMYRGGVPDSGRDTEVIVRGFRFTPLAAPIAAQPAPDTKIPSGVAQ